EGGVGGGGAGRRVGAGLPAAVEVVGGGEVLDGEGVDVPPRRGQGVEDGALEPLPAPVGIRRPRVARRRHGRRAGPRDYRNAGAISAMKRSRSRRRSASGRNRLGMNTASTLASRSRWSCSLICS